MADATGDRWAQGDAYEAYMGRWSRSIAAQFVRWLRPPVDASWLDVGCGTGALTSNICQLAKPSAIVACDQSATFIEHARASLRTSATSFTVATVDALPSTDHGFDLVVSGLVLNFFDQPRPALEAMRARTRPGGVVAAYIWDYAAGLEFLHHFWEHAVALDPDAAPLDESRRFAAWTPHYLASCFQSAGLAGVVTDNLTVSTSFPSFGDFWVPFLGGTGPAPAYVASLNPAQRDLLAQRLRAHLPVDDTGAIRLHASAWAVRGVA